MKLHFLSFALGRGAADLLLATLLPNQISAGNLGAFQHARDCRYRIYCSEGDAPRIAAAPVTAKLRDLIATDIVAMPDIGTGKGRAGAEADIVRCHQEAVATAEDADAGIMFLPDNAVWSDGAFRHAADLGDSGAAAVLVLGLAVARETFQPAFNDRFLEPAALQATACARDLVGLALAHLHPLTRALFSDAPQAPKQPPHVIWRAGDQGMAVKAFRLLPLLIQPKFPGSVVRVPLDQDYWRKACPDRSRLHVVTDSDQICKIVLERESTDSGLLTPHGLNLTYLTSVVRGKDHEDFERQIFLERTIRLHAGEDCAVLQNAERQAKNFADRLRFAMSA